MNLHYRIGIDIGRKLSLEDGVAWAAAHAIRFVDVQLDTGANALGTIDAPRAATLRGGCERHGIHLGLHTSSAVNVAEYAPYVGDAVLRTEVRPTPAVEVGIYVPPINCPTCRAVRTAAICADAAAQGRDDGPTGGGGAGDPAADQTASGLSRMLAAAIAALNGLRYSRRNFSALVTIRMALATDTPVDIMIPI